MAPAGCHQLFIHATMKSLKKILKLSGRILFALLFSLCMVIGVAPVIPKRKEQFNIEIKAEPGDKKEAITATAVLFNEND